MLVASVYSLLSALAPQCLSTLSLALSHFLALREREGLSTRRIVFLIIYTRTTEHNIKRPYDDSQRVRVCFAVSILFYKHTNRENNAKSRRRRRRRRPRRFHRVFGRNFILLTNSFIRMEATPYEWCRHSIRLISRKNYWIIQFFFFSFFFSLFP